MTPNDKINSFIRTYVPYAIGAAVAYVLAATTIDLSGEFQTALIAIAVVVAQNVYYLAVRLAETKLPSLGVLLGLPEVPKYGAVNDLWASVVRTGIPTIVGALVAIVVAAIGGVEGDAATGVTVTAIAVAQAAYYAVAQWLTRRFPATGFLLGTSAQPAYEARHAA
jgi:hypothetical protein